MSPTSPSKIMTSSTNKSSSSFKNIVSAVDRALLEERYEFVPSQSYAAESATATGTPATTSTTTNNNTTDTTTGTTWQDRMVQRYHDGLYREYALADLSRPGQLGLRWRTKQEVMNGRGERSCGNKHCGGLVSSKSNHLVTVEVPFAYMEGGISKKELVKLNLCPTCLPLVQPNATNSPRLGPHPPNDSQADGTDRTTESLSQSNGKSSRLSVSSSSSSSCSSSSPKKKRRRRPKDRRRWKHHEHSKRFKKAKH